jgi:sarcosine oxidase, subunit alpha
MAHRLKPIETRLTFECDGVTIEANQGESFAAALIAQNEPLFSRSIKYHRPRGAFCLTGDCANCLVRINGLPNLPACQATATQGAQLHRQNSFPDAKFDVFAANDLVFPKWFNHHEFLAGVPIADAVMLKIARQLAGLGLLPDNVKSVGARAETVNTEVAIVGAGAAGTAASKYLSSQNIAHLVFDRQERAIQGDAKIESGATVLGVYRDFEKNFLLVKQHDNVKLVFYRWLLLANGGHATPMTFENNDLPGIYSAHAALSLLETHRIAVGKTVAVVGEMDACRALAERLTSFGVACVAVGERPLKGHGGLRVTALTTSPWDSSARASTKYECDAVVICSKDSAAYELARTAGAKVRWDERSESFVVDAAASGQTHEPSVFVAGQVRGPMSAAAAAQQGLVAASAVAKNFL